MTQDLETILRKSLNQTDRSMKGILVCWVFMAAAVAGGLLWLQHLSETADVKTMIVFSVVIVLFGLSNCLLLTCVVVIAMTRRVLKAIELMSKE
jgi:hypothetical protein